MTYDTFNIVRHRGDPKKATLESGHEVEKNDHVFIKDQDGKWLSLKCADYHNEHFVYIDPLYLVDGPAGRGHWFAMCTCGSPAVILGPSLSGRTHDAGVQENMLVCQIYMVNLLQYGVGVHAGQDRRQWT